MLLSFQFIIKDEQVPGFIISNEIIAIVQSDLYLKDARIHQYESTCTLYLRSGRDVRVIGNYRDIKEYVQTHVREYSYQS